MSLSPVENAASLVSSTADKAAAGGERARAGALFSALLRGAMTAQGLQSATPAADRSDPGLGSLRTLMALEMARSLLDVVAGEEDESVRNEGPQSGGDSASPSAAERTTSNNRRAPASGDGAAKGGYDGIIATAAAAHDVEPELIRAVIRVESNFEAGSTSPKGAMGLMQLMPGTAKDLGVKNPYDPEENIHGGVRYLKGLLKRFDGDVAPALAAYNWGMGNVERRPERMPRETRAYVARVMQEYEKAKQDV
jgi:soluble lytic murein transglycosylase-like protein